GGAAAARGCVDGRIPRPGRQLSAHHERGEEGLTAICQDDGMRVFGDHERQTIAQLERCAAAEPDAPAVLCADGHLGYSMPIGGVVGYRAHVSPSGVGYDIACGNLAVRTDLRASEVAPAEIRRLAREIDRRIS